MSVLPRDFYDRPTLEVARDLLGKTLVRELPAGRVALRIVETEAYIGENDQACHASKGMTARNHVMFGEPGHAYVYLIYGMYNCLNLVTERDGYPAAVLIRAGEPIDGEEIMASLRPKAKKPHEIASGPGKLCGATNITKALNGADVCASGELYVEDGPAVKKIVACPRIGVDYAGEDALRPWRFYDKRSPCVSKRAIGDYANDI
ncbi:DNA-3-methyladenine glycosylase [Methanocella sp. MCL-LM]|uniref:DNA-3-methyladenine glycosylase n=1 Tax=Methanocella sp. MCL-LM TaxID=3412035 RepID=UPI003C77B9C2